MNIEVPVEELRKRSVFLATPMYGGMCYGSYTKSLIDLTVECIKYGINLRHYFLSNESLITRARAYSVDEFLRSDCSHLMFIDSDISFKGTDVLTLLALMSEESEYDVMCGPYPKKNISWEKIYQAVNKGVADKNYNVLENYVGDYVFNPIHTNVNLPLDRPFEIAEGGTGFMMIKRSILEKTIADNPQLMYKPDHVRTAEFDGSRKISMIFDTEIDKETERYLSEDYFFCKKVRQSGGKVWLAPWMELQHTGTYTFGGSLAALASVGASATADEQMLKNTKK